MAEDVPLAELGPDLVYYFSPSRRWAQTRAEWLFDKLERTDFGPPDCQPEDLRIGQLGAIIEYGTAEIQSLAYGERGFGPNDHDAYLVTIDWHGTPTYFISRDCPARKDIIKMGLLDAQPVIRVVKASDVPEVREFLARKMDAGETVDVPEPEPVQVDVPEPERVQEEPKGFFARLFGR